MYFVYTIVSPRGSWPLMRTRPLPAKGRRSARAIIQFVASFVNRERALEVADEVRNAAAQFR